MELDLFCRCRRPSSIHEACFLSWSILRRADSQSLCAHDSDSPCRRGCVRQTHRVRWCNPSWKRLSFCKCQRVLSHRNQSQSRVDVSRLRNLNRCTNPALHLIDSRQHGNADRHRLVQHGSRWQRVLHPMQMAAIDC